MLLDQKVNLKSNNLNLLRLLLATVVLFFHLNNIGQFHKDSIWMTSGDEAVRLFFVISGCLIYASFEKDRNLLKYTSRRVFRIFPLYIFIILAQYLLMLFWALQDFDYSYTTVIKGSIKYLGANLALMNFLDYQLLDVLKGVSKAINGSLWSIKVEVVFYIFLPFLGFFLTKSFKWKFITLYLISLVLWYICQNIPSLTFLKSQLPAQLFWFLLGMLLFRYKDVFTFKHLIWIDGLSIILFVLTKLIGIDHPLLTELVYFPAFAFSIVYLFSMTRVGVPALKQDISYGVYLLHYPIIVTFKYYGLLSANYWISLSYVFVLVYVSSYFLHIMIEKPFMALGRKMKTERS